LYVERVKDPILLISINESIVTILDFHGINSQ